MQEYCLLVVELSSKGFYHLAESRAIWISAGRTSVCFSSVFDCLLFPCFGSFFVLPACLASILGLCRIACFFVRSP